MGKFDNFLKEMRGQRFLGGQYHSSTVFGVKKWYLNGSEEIWRLKIPKKSKFPGIGWTCWRLRVARLPSGIPSDLSRTTATRKKKIRIKSRRVSNFAKSANWLLNFSNYSKSRSPLYSLLQIPPRDSLASLTISPYPYIYIDIYFILYFYDS